MLESEATGPQNVTLFGDRLYGSNQVEMRSLGWALFQYDWWLYQKGKFQHRHTPREKVM